MGEICWLDLETTGSSPDSAILEIGLALTDDSPDFNILKTLSKVVKPWYFTKAYLQDMDPVVIEMHTKNGLLKDLEAVKPMNSLQVESELLDFLGKGSAHIPLAGSGVCHFDRQFIRRYFPSFDKRFTYWTYDIGVIRRVFRLCGVPVPNVEETKSHRALEDVLGDIEQMRQYVKVISAVRMDGTPTEV